MPQPCVCGMKNKMKEKEGEREKDGDNPQILLHAQAYLSFLQLSHSTRNILLDTARFRNPFFVDDLKKVQEKLHNLMEGL